MCGEGAGTRMAPARKRARAPGCVAAFNVKNCMVNDFKAKIESDDHE